MRTAPFPITCEPIIDITDQLRASNTSILHQYWLYLGLLIDPSKAMLYSK